MREYSSLLVKTGHWLLPLLVSVFLILAVAACSKSTDPIKTEADINGFITEIKTVHENGISGLISVESHADKIVSQYIIKVKNDTSVFQEQGDKLSKTDFKNMENKQWIKVWLDGPLLESWPMQGTALQIVISDQ